MSHIRVFNSSMQQCTEVCYCFLSLRRPLLIIVRPRRFHGSLLRYQHDIFLLLRVRQEEDQQYARPACINSLAIYKRFLCIIFFVRFWLVEVDSSTPSISLRMSQERSRIPGRDILHVLPWRLGG